MQRIQLNYNSDGKYWWWCPKHNNLNEGIQCIWVRHKPENHKKDFQPQQFSDGKKNTNPDGEKGTNNDGNPEPAIKVDNKI